MPADPRMVFLGFGKYARADKIFALEPIRGDDRGEGRRTRVWVEGIANPIVAARTERISWQRWDRNEPRRHSSSTKHSN